MSLALRETRPHPHPGATVPEAGAEKAPLRVAHRDQVAVLRGVLPRVGRRLNGGYIAVKNKHVPAPQSALTLLADPDCSGRAFGRAGLYRFYHGWICSYFHILRPFGFGFSCGSIAQSGEFCKRENKRVLRRGTSALLAWFRRTQAGAGTALVC